MSAMASHFTGVSIAQPFVQAPAKDNIKAPRHWPLWKESTGDRWIPLIKGQQREKCFYLMTSCCHSGGLLGEQPSVPVQTTLVINFAYKMPMMRRYLDGERRCFECLVAIDINIHVYIIYKMWFPVVPLSSFI